MTWYIWHYKDKLKAKNQEPEIVSNFPRKRDVKTGHVLREWVMILFYIRYILPCIW